MGMYIWYGIVADMLLLGVGPLRLSATRVYLLISILENLGLS